MAEPAIVGLDEDEQKAMDDLLASMRRIYSWGLVGSDHEMVAAVHVIQGFIVQRMLHRLNPEKWNNWYAEIRLRDAEFHPPPVV